MKGAVSSPLGKLLKLHGGPLDGSVVSKSATFVIFIGDVCYRYKEEDKDYYHYKYTNPIEEEQDGKDNT